MHDHHPISHNLFLPSPFSGAAAPCLAAGNDGGSERSHLGSSFLFLAHSFHFSCVVVHDMKEEKENSSGNFYPAIWGVFRRVSGNHIEYVSLSNFPSIICVISRVFIKKIWGFWCKSIPMPFESKFVVPKPNRSSSCNTPIFKLGIVKN